MLGCLLLALPFAYLIDYTSFVANTAVALVPCHTVCSPALLYSSAVLLSLPIPPTVRFGLSDLVFLCFCLCQLIAQLTQGYLFYHVSILSFAFLSYLCGIAINQPIVYLQLIPHLAKGMICTCYYMIILHNLYVFVY